MTRVEILAVDAALADRIRDLRRCAGMSRRELAVRSGVPERAIECIEVGKSSKARRFPRRRVSVGEAIALAQGLGVRVTDLLRSGGVR